MANNFSAGWNDPPMLGYTPQGSKSGVRDMFSRRVAFPLNSDMSSPLNQAQPLSGPSIVPNGVINHHFSQPYLHAIDNINRSASSPCFSQEDHAPNIPNNGPFPINANQYVDNHHVNHDQSVKNGQLEPNLGEKVVKPPVNHSAAVYMYTSEDIMGNLSAALASCTATIQPLAASNVERRLSSLKTSLDNNSLSVTCRERLCVLIGHLVNHRYKEAYDVHSVMMIEHYSEVNPWMVGVKAVIMECLKKK